MLNSSLLSEPILINMDKLGDYSLHSISHQLSDKLKWSSQQGNRPVIIYRRRALNFRNQSDVRGIDASKI
jgi:hypothetical protein